VKPEAHASVSRLPHASAKDTVDARKMIERMMTSIMISETNGWNESLGKLEKLCRAYWHWQTQKILLIS